MRAGLVASLSTTDVGVGGESEVVIRTVQKLPHERGDEANSILFTRQID
jgi:hypothetical protein